MQKGEAITHRQSGDEVKGKKVAVGPHHWAYLLTAVMMFESAMTTKPGLHGTITQNMQEFMKTIGQYL